MWWDPTVADFITVQNGLVEGIGRLSSSKFQQFDNLMRGLKKRVEDYEKKTKDPNRVLLSITKAMHHACIRLGFLNCAFVEMQFGVTEFQRYYLEVLGMLDYLEIYKPRIDGVLAHATSIANCIGAYTSTPRVVQDFHDAGLPVWFSRDISVIAASLQSPNVLKLVPPRKPLVLVLEDANPSFPLVYRGHSNTHYKHVAMHSYSRTWMVYHDPFSKEEIPTGVGEVPVDPFTSNPVPATTSVTVPMRDLYKPRLLPAPAPAPILPSTSAPQHHQARQQPLSGEPVSSSLSTILIPT